MKLVAFIPFLDQTLCPFYEKLHQWWIEKEGEGNFVVLVSAYLNHAFVESDGRGKRYHPYWVEEVIPNSEQFYSIMNSADVIISHFTRRDYYWPALKPLLKNKLFFFFSERLYREGFPLRRFPRNFASSFRWIRPVQKYAPLLLAVGTYCYHDYQIFHRFTKRSLDFCYYLPISNQLNKESVCDKYSVLGNESEPIKILVVGRMVEPRLHMLAFDFVEEFQKRGKAVDLVFVGDGPSRQKLEATAKLVCPSRVSFTGVLPIESVVELIAQSHIYLVTGGSGEGYNCAAFLAAMVGTYVIYNAKNGCSNVMECSQYPIFVANNKKKHGISETVASFLDCCHDGEITDFIEDQRIRLFQEWSVETAVSRFYDICISVREGGLRKKDIGSLFDSGVLSESENVRRPESVDW